MEIANPAYFIVPFNDAAYKSKQMLPGGSKTRSATQVRNFFVSNILARKWDFVWYEIWGYIHYHHY